MDWLTDDDYVYHLENDLVRLTGDSNKLERQIKRCPHDDEDWWDLIQEKENIDRSIKITNYLLNKFKYEGLRV